MRKFLHRTTLAILLTVGVAVVFSLPAASIPQSIPDSSERLCVVSLNLAKETDPSRVREDLQSGPCETVDVFLLQEVAKSSPARSVAEEVGEQLGYRVSFWAPEGVVDQGLAILTRHPLDEAEVIRLKAHDLKFRTRQRFTLSTVTHTQMGDVRLWNVHLDTRINPEERVEQLKPVLIGAASEKGPSLIGGDLNTTRFHWLANVVPYPGRSSHASFVRAAMTAIGFQTPFSDETTTFQFLHQHLDWMFVRNLRAEDCGTYPTKYSDHYAIWATFTT